MEKLIAAAAPQSLAIAATYVAVILLLGVALSLRVVWLRNTLKVGLGDGGDRRLGRAIRVHGNFSEYAPLIIAVLILLPFLGAKEWLVHLVGLSGLVGRVAHAIGVTRTGGPSIGRIGGMALSFTALITGAIALLVLAWR